jgi:nitrogenase molybdenum-iron cofactor biosynthesis protein NifN
MAKIVLSSKALTVNPLKASQPIGASLAFLGVANAMPLEHGARGCTSFNKLFFMRHFNEPIPLQTTAMEQTTTVLGADDNVVDALATIAKKNNPEVVALITTGLSEMQGADVPRTIKMFRKKHPEYAHLSIVPVAASDTLGCLETGFAEAVEAIINAMVPEGSTAGKRRNEVNLLVPASLTPGDIDEVKGWIEAFGLHPVVLPDLADSLDGHLSDAGYLTLTYGGTTRSAIQTMGLSVATLVIGSSMSKAADALIAKTGVPDWRFPSVMGLANCDLFTGVLAEISGRQVPASVIRGRARLEDAMVDCQFQLGGAKAGVAADADHLAALTGFFVSLGIDVVAAVSSMKSDLLEALPVEQVVVGDLEDFERLVRENAAEIIVTNSHGIEIAKRTGSMLLRAGFPVFDSHAANSEVWIGYNGSRRTIFRIADLLAAHYQEIAPYVSRFRQSMPELTPQGVV